MLVDEELTCDALTADYRLLQRKRGHRFSLDDLATAWVASRACPKARTVLDLGCGIGSVLLMVGWRLRAARLFGVEAQEISFELAQRNVALNGASDRAAVRLGDLREITLKWPEIPCDLVTGTPPYLPLGSALLSPDPQRAAARIELRGGVEDYLAAASRALAPDGRAVVCADGRYPERVVRGAAAAGLAPIRQIDFFAHAGSPAPLLAVWICARSTAEREAHAREQIVMRDERGERTDASRSMRAWFGLT